MLEYIFENRKYEAALRDVKAILFDVVSTEEAKIASLMSEIYESDDAERQAELIEVCNAQDECLKRVLKIFSDLEKTFKKLDSFTRDYNNIKKSKMAEIIAKYNELVAQTGVDTKKMGIDDVDDINSPAVTARKEEQTATQQEPVVENSEPVVTNQPAEENVEEVAVQTASQPEPQPEPEPEPVEENTETVVEEKIEPAEEKAPEAVVETSTDEVAPSADTKEETTPPVEEKEQVVEETPVEEKTEMVQEEKQEEPAPEPVVETPADEVAPSTDNKEEITPAVEEAPAEEDVIIPYDDSISTVEEIKETDTKEPEKTEDKPASETEQESEPLLQPVDSEGLTDDTSNNNVAGSSLPEIVAEGELKEPSIEIDAQKEETVDSLLTMNPIKEEEPAEDKLVFKKRTDEPAKVILTSAKQTSNLRKSLETQEALIKSKLTGEITEDNLEAQLVDNGLLPGDVNSKQAQVEQLTEQANALYAEGKLEEAQVLVDKISAISKELQSMNTEAVK